jgi:hypothetical protein
MNTNIFIPKKIKVGFQNRDDTYTKKLAYVIYYDQKNKLRKEASWEGWRDKNINPEDYDNEPTSGFVLNKKVGGYQYHYDMRQTYVRVFDPRGFEFEITIPNLLYILENTSAIKGKGLEGDFVYGWDGKDLLLIPTSAPEYQEMQKITTTLYEGESIKAKDLVIGYTYGTADGKAYVYMGKSDYWDRQRNSQYCRSYRWPKEYDWSYPLDETWQKDITKGDNYRYRNINKGKRFWFATINGNIVSYTSISKKFYSVIDAHISEKFAEYQDILDGIDDYSPINYAASKITPITYEEFEEFAHSIPNDHSYDVSRYIKSYTDNQISEKPLYRVRQEDKWYLNRGYHQVTCQTLKELYEEIKPIKTENYLMNGKQYKKGWY